ncbi:MAG: hypothetical protein JST00_44955 [Deltaproteobacteria bacterium]|nr:hypothetical protein [Deltaproteobacteria bacterium]
MSTLIVQREIASIREVEEALARQVLYGGDFVTNLLEVCRVDEAALLPVVAESFGLPPANAGELPRATDEAKRLVVAEVAGERNLAPLSVDRNGLTVAVAQPLSPEVEQELAFALALPIHQRIAPLVRIRQALARDYALPFDRRLQRLLLRMLTEDPRKASSFPPPPEGHRPAERLVAPRPPSANPPPHTKSSEQPAARLAALAGGAPAPMPPGATLVKKTPEQLGSMRPIRRRRGPLTLEVAKNELDEATERDTIFDLFFEFARQYFDYTAVFIVHGEIAEGRDAFGDGAPRDRVARIGVPLDLPGLLASAREKKGTLQRVPAADGLDAVLMSDLGRPGKTVCIVVPIVVRTRVVALLLGDGGETGIDDATLEDIHAIVASSTAAFERLIVRRKLKGSVAPPEGMLGSVAPPGASLAPPTMLSENREEAALRPAAEELAPPIRDLMTEPVSRVSPTAREPVVEAHLPPLTKGGEGLDRPKAKEPSLPPVGLVVRRPSGAPIPREEPDSNAADPPARSAPPGSSRSGPPSSSRSGPPSSRGASGYPKSRQRAEAPPLEFGAAPPPESSVFGSTREVAEAEARMQEELKKARAFEAEPLTSRDPEPSAAMDWPPKSSGETLSADYGPSTPSPKAESPPPMPVARPVAVTDMSPIGLPAPVEVPPQVESAPIAETTEPPPVVEAAPEVEEEIRPSAPGLEVSPEDGDVDVVDPWGVSDRDTPLAPPVATDPPPVADPPPLPSAVTVTSSLRSSPVSPKGSKPMPPSEQQISVAAHRPPSSRSDHSRVLPSVIVDVASEYVGLVERALKPAGDEEAEAALVRAGGYAMPAIMEHFPGPVTIEQERLEKGPLPRVAECGPIVRLVAGQRRVALPFVLSHVEDPDEDKRYWATFLLTELIYPDVLDPIVNRVFDPSKRIRRVARAAARVFAETTPGPIVERLELIAMDASQPVQNRGLAIEALGETREPVAVPALMPLLDDPDRSVVDAVRMALIKISRQDFGTSSEKWRAWWTANKERHRVEWLIDALMHDMASIRAAAGEELKTTTKEYFGYYDDLPKRERERAQARYREWWNGIGKVRFSRPSSTRG